jgi:ubiquinone/menaquinone biosynthesis C-methylase UbiE
MKFKNASFDHTVAFQVLEHHINPEELIKEMYRITKPGGLIFLTVPFLGGIHEEPHDYQRYTKFGLAHLFDAYKSKILILESYGSIASTISTLLNEELCNFANINRMNYFISLILYPPLLIIQYLSLFIDLFIKSDHIVRGYLILVKKI